MATREETQIQWGGSASKSVSNGSSQTSDAVTFSAGDWAAAIQINADNDGAPASGDTLDVYILWTAGDVDGSAGDDYDTPEHGQHLCTLDTYATSGGSDPARKTVDIGGIAAKSFKLYAKNNSGGRAITIRARLITQRGAIS